MDMFLYRFVVNLGSMVFEMLIY